MSRLQPGRRTTGEWWVWNATLKEANGSAMNIAGALAIRYAVSAEEGGAAIIEATLVNGMVTIVDGPTGRADITIETDDHSAIEAGSYWHECSVTLSTGRVSSQFHGPLTIEASTP